MLIVLAAILLIVGVFIVAVGIDGAELLPFILGSAMVAVGVFLVVKEVKKQDRRDSHEARIELVKEGWDVSRLHGDYRLDVGCVALDVNKVSGTYQVTKNRAATAGGGYIILKSSIQKQLKAACP